MGSLGKSSVASTPSVTYHEFTGSPGSNTGETHAFFNDANNTNQSDWENLISSIKDAYNGMKDFTGSSYNGYFAKLYNTEWSKIPPEYRKKIAALSNAIRNYELKQNIVVHRSTDFQIFGAAKSANLSLSDLQSFEGKYLHNNSFLSSAAAYRGVGVQSSKVDLKIHVPAGKGWGAFVGKSGLSSLGSNESEFLLNNNLWFKVGKSRFNAKTGKNEVDLYIVGRSSGQKFGNDKVTSGPDNGKKK